MSAGGTGERQPAQQRQSTDLLQSLEREVQRARGGFGESSKVDSVESPRKEERKPAPATADYMVVFVLDRHGAIATRFGDEVLHGVLRFVNQRLKESLASGDRLVRWKGAAFLASLSRDRQPAGHPRRVVERGIDSRAAID